MKPIPSLSYNSKDREVIQEVWILLHTHPAGQHSIRNLAALTGVNRNKLVYGFRRYYGQTIHQLLITIRMEAAKEMLLANEKPIKKIAQLSGYRNPPNFITAFKKYTGQTPMQFQKCIRMDNATDCQVIK